MREREIRYAEFRATDNGLEGTVIRYGDIADIQGFQETINPGVLSVRGDLILNQQHQRSRPIARLGTKYLQVENTDEDMTLSLTWPDTPIAAEARALVDAELYRGLSLEMYVDSEEWDGRNRTITAGRVFGIGLVDDPAYPQSTLNRSSIPIQLTGELPMYEDRARNIFGGQMLWDAISVVSTQRRRAVRFAPGSLDIEMMPVVLLMGSNFDSPLASSGANSIQLSSDGDGVRWSARKLASTTTGGDVRKLFRQKLITGFRFGYVNDPDGTEMSKVDIGGFEYDLETIRSAAMLCDIRLATDGTGGIGPVKRERNWDGDKWTR